MDCPNLGKNGWSKDNQIRCYPTVIPRDDFVRLPKPNGKRNDASEMSGGAGIREFVLFAITLSYRYYIVLYALYFLVQTFEKCAENVLQMQCYLDLAVRLLQIGCYCLNTLSRLREPLCQEPGYSMRNG